MLLWLLYALYCQKLCQDVFFLFSISLLTCLPSVCKSYYTVWQNQNIHENSCINPVWVMISWTDEILSLRKVYAFFGCCMWHPQLFILSVQTFKNNNLFLVLVNSIKIVLWKVIRAVYIKNIFLWILLDKKECIRRSCHV